MLLPVRHLRLATSLSRRLPAGRLPIALTAGVGAVALITHAAGQRRGAADCSAASVPSRSSTALARKESSGAASGGLWRLTKILLRCLELFAFLCPVAAWCLLQQLPLLGGAFSRERQLSLLVSALARCGPVGIKWGQWASTRYDLFEEDFCEALGTLTNAAPAHGYAHSRAAIEAAFGQPLGSLFDSFDEKPVASGSIGQARHGPFRDASREHAETRRGHDQRHARPPRKRRPKTCRGGVSPTRPTRKAGPPRQAARRRRRGGSQGAAPEPRRTSANLGEPRRTSGGSPSPGAAPEPGGAPLARHVAAARTRRLAATPPSPERPSLDPSRKALQASLRRGTRQTCASERRQTSSQSTFARSSTSSSRRAEI